MKALVFDADHTLYEPVADRAYDEKFAFLADETGIDEGALRDAWQDALARVDGSDHPDERERRALLRDMLKRAGAEPDDALVAAAHDLFWDAVVDDLEVEAEVAAMLDRLHDRFDTLAVATDEFPDAVHAKLEAAVGEPDRLFDAVVTPRETGIMKPAPQFYTEILTEHDIAPEDAVMVGDSWRRDLAPAAAIGMRTVLVGSDEGEPDVRIDSILELEEALEVLQDES